MAESAGKAPLLACHAPKKKAYLTTTPRSVISTLFVPVRPMVLTEAKVPLSCEAVIMAVPEGGWG